MANPTFLTLATDAMFELGYLAADETPESFDTALAIRYFNRMLGQWNIDRLMAFRITTGSYTLTAGKSPHTIGIDPAGVLTADFAVARPTKIDYAHLLIDSKREPLDILTPQTWETVWNPSASGQPTAIYCDRNAPLANLYFDFVPDAAYVLELQTWQQLTAVTATTDELVLAPGYEEPLMYNLAVRLAAPLGAKLQQATVTLAQEGRAAIARMNTPILLMSCDDAVLGTGGGYDIKTDCYR